MKSAYLKELIVEYEPLNLCPRHSSNKLIYFCKECNIQICNKCINEKHQNHIYEKNDYISKENAEFM